MDKAASLVRLFLIPLTTIYLSCVTPVFADDGKFKTSPKENHPEINPVLMAFGIEALIGVNAWMASLNPKVYGGAGMLLFPLAAVNAPSAPQNESDEKATWLFLGATESVAIYNLTLDKDRDSKKSIFEKNMIAWNGAVAIAGTLAWLISDEEKKPLKEQNFTYMFHPTAKGAGLTFSYRF